MWNFTCTGVYTLTQACLCACDLIFTLLLLIAMSKSFFFLSAAGLVALSAVVFLWASWRWESRLSAHPPSPVPEWRVPAENGADSLCPQEVTILAAV
jgi:hypothetical protein